MISRTFTGRLFNPLKATFASSKLDLDHKNLFSAYDNFNALVKRIDGDAPHIYCLLVTESWNPR
jgi:hypothetical protein